MIYFLVYLFIFAYGLWYAINALRSLKRKFGEDGVPPASIKTARIVGIVIAAAGLAGLIYTAVQYFKG